MIFNIDSIANRLISEIQKCKKDISKVDDQTKYNKLLSFNTVGLKLPRQSGKTFWAIRRALSYRGTLVLVKDRKSLEMTLEAFEDQLIKVSIPEDVKKRLIPIKEFINKSIDLSDIDTIIIDDYKCNTNSLYSESTIYERIVELKGNVVIITLD